MGYAKSSGYAGFLSGPPHVLHNFLLSSSWVQSLSGWVKATFVRQRIESDFTATELFADHYGCDARVFFLLFYYGLFPRTA